MEVAVLIPVYHREFYHGLWETQATPLPTIAVDGRIWQMGSRFVHDKSSMHLVVQLILRLQRSNGVTDSAAAWHDWFYRWLLRIDSDRHFAQKYADKVFFKLMRQGIPDPLPDSGVPWYRPIKRWRAERHNRIVRRLRTVVARKYWAVRKFGHLFLGPGDGTPPKKVRRAMAAKGIDWRTRLA